MENVRKFGTTDANLFEFTGKVLGYLQEDLESFSRFDPDLNGEKMQSLTDLYQRALAFGTDNTERGKVTQLTEIVLSQLTMCADMYHEVLYFAKKCFTDSPAILKQFCGRNYRKARNSQPDMVVFMHELAHTTRKYIEQLVKAGLNERMPDVIAQAAKTLEQANVSQEIGKSYRVLKTEERVHHLNMMYAILAEYGEAAKIVFASDPLRRDRYKLPNRKKGNGHDDKGNHETE